MKLIIEFPTLGTAMCNRMISTWCHLIQRQPHVFGYPDKYAIFRTLRHVFEQVIHLLWQLLFLMLLTVSSSRHRDSLTATDQQGARRRKRHKKESTTHDAVDPTPGTVNVIRVLSMDSQTAVKCQISSFTTHTLTCSATKDTCLMPLDRGFLLQTLLKLC